MEAELAAEWMEGKLGGLRSCNYLILAGSC